MHFKNIAHRNKSSKMVYVLTFLSATFNNELRNCSDLFIQPLLLDTVLAKVLKTAGADFTF